MSAPAIELGQVDAPDRLAMISVLSELWISFVGLTRSHLGALQISGQLLQATVQETSANSFTMGDLNGNIQIALGLERGAGTYELKSCGGPRDRGTWRLQPDGTACVDSGQPEDMELVVETFAQKLASARMERGANQ